MPSEKRYTLTRMFGRVYWGKHLVDQARFRRPPSSGSAGRGDSNLWNPSTATVARIDSFARVPRWDFGDVMLLKARPRAPKYLRAETRRWWESVVAGWELDPHHLRLLTLAAEAWDRCQQAREEIRRDGLTTSTREGGAKLHPACRVEASSQIAFMRALRELDLDIAGPSVAKRPPTLRSIRGHDAS